MKKEEEKIMEGLNKNNNGAEFKNNIADLSDSCLKNFLNKGIKEANEDLIKLNISTDFVIDYNDIHFKDFTSEDDIEVLLSETLGPSQNIIVQDNNFNLDDYDSSDTETGTGNK